MKRYLFAFSLFCCFINNSVEALSKNEWDFLTYAENDSAVIRQLRNDTTLRPSDCFEFYVVYKHKPVYSQTELKWNWIPNLLDSAFVHSTTEYLIQCIVRDTALSHLENLFTVYLNNSKFDRDIIYESAEWIVSHFWGKETIEIALLFNYNRYIETRDSSYMVPYFYYAMYEYMVLGKKHILGDFFNCNDLLMNTNYSTEYEQFRTYIDTLSPDQLARLTSSDKENLAIVLRNGIAKQDMRCQLAYYCMILTGNINVDFDKTNAVRFLEQYLRHDIGISVDDIVMFCNSQNL